MNIEDLTVGQAKELVAMFGSQSGLNDMIGQSVIVRTYSAGCWFGRLEKKSGNEVIIADARRMWRWHAAESISLSACAIFGIDQAKSKIISAVPHAWLEAIEIIPCEALAAKSLREAPNVAAE